MLSWPLFVFVRTLAIAIYHILPHDVNVARRMSVNDVRNNFVFIGVCFPGPGKKANYQVDQSSEIR